MRTRQMRRKREASRGALITNGGRCLSVLTQPASAECKRQHFNIDDRTGSPWKHLLEFHRSNNSSGAAGWAGDEEGERDAAGLRKG